MLSRRNFLRSSVASAAVLSFPSLLQSQAATHPLGLQLYTVRTLAGHDLPALLGKIRKIGYQEVETYWDVYTHPARDLRKMIADAGLRVPSGHFDYDGLQQKFDYAKELGVEYIVCPMLPKDMWNSVDGFKKAADQFNKWGERAQGLGLQFAFHNHNYEFKRFGNTTGFDTLISGTDPKLVKLEMDCYWITQAGQNPVEMLKKYSDRVRMIHLKDREKGFPSSQELNSSAEHFAEVGTGSIEWKPIIATAEQQGIKHMFVEQDHTTHDPLESIAISYRNAAKFLQSA